MIIYCIRHRVTGCCYIGQTIHTLLTRKKQHVKAAALGDARAFYQDLRQQGEDAFEFSELEGCASREELNARECFWIAQAGALHPAGYNLTKGGSSGMEVSELTRSRMRKARKPQVFSPEALRKRSASLRRAHASGVYSRESLRFMWDANRGTKKGPRSSEVRQKIGAGQRAFAAGGGWSEERRRKVSEKQKGRVAYTVHNYLVCDSNTKKQFHTSNLRGFSREQGVPHIRLWRALLQKRAVKGWAVSIVGEAEQGEIHA